MMIDLAFGPSFGTSREALYRGLGDDGGPAPLHPDLLADSDLIPRNGRSGRVSLREHTDFWSI